MNRPSSRPLALCATSMRAGQRLLSGRSARPTPALTSLPSLMPSPSPRSPSAGATKTGLRTARSADSSPVLPLPEWDQCPIDHEKDSGHLAEAVPGPKLTSEPNAYIPGMRLREAVMMITRGWTSSTGIALVALAVAVLGPSLAAAQPPPAPSGTPPASAPAETAPTAAPSDTPPAQRNRTREIFPVLPETEILRSPDTVPPPPLPPVGAGLLETSFPAVGDSMSKLPPFFRYTDLTVHFRTFYFTRQKDNGTASEAWAMGGWIQYASGWLLDTFAMGTTYYLSAQLYAPDNSPGSLLLTPGQGTISVVGEAWGALRYKEYALLRGGRVKIEEGYLNPQDNRMVPNTFEGITLSGKLDWVQYDVGYVWPIKPRDSNDFISMSQQAGASGKGEGVVLGSLAL